MILDQNLLFSDAQAITAAADSTNILDLGKAAQNPGVGDQELYIFATVTEDFVDSGSDSTLEVKLTSGATDTPSGTERVLFTLPAVALAGTTLYAKFVPNGANELLQYHKLVYTPANGNLTSGKVTAGVVKGIDAFRAYAKNYQSR